MGWPLLLLLSAARPTSARGAEIPVVALRNGRRFPLLGLGCASGVRQSHVLSALEIGYRSFDTAQAYQWGYHEEEVGEAVYLSGIPREELFLQSKIHPEDLGYAATKQALAVSLRRLNTTYLDAILLHKPRCWPGACARHPEGTWQESWRALEDVLDDGLVRAIGICDVDEPLLEELLQQRQKPHIIQNWMDPFHQDREVRQRCREAGIQYQAYSSLGTQWVHFRGHILNPVFANQVLRTIAEQREGNVAQVVLAWALHHGVAVIPASTSKERQRSNLDSFGLQLSPADVARIDGLDGALDPLSAEVGFENSGKRHQTVHSEL
ncbi:yvgN [Symbiodinium sp. CCMP2456]|nr:yvgN [Symbiodinium sp. CCMP2456]